MLGPPFIGTTIFYHQDYLTELRGWPPQFYALSLTVAAVTTVVFALVCGAWVAAATLWGPAEYSVWGALKEHFVDRGIHGMHHAQPWWYYAKVLPPQLLPWTFLVPGALILAWRRRDRMDRFLLVTVIFVVLTFSISTEKRTLYVLPAFPAFALLTARFVGAILGWDEAPSLSRRWITVGQSFFSTMEVERKWPRQPRRNR